MQKIFLTSDTHFGHKRIIELDGRPYEDLQDMEDSIVENWNSLVGKQDFVYHLGDFAFSPRSEVERLLGRLNGQKRLIIGNHDDQRVINAKGWCVPAKHYAEVKHKDKLVCMSHFAMLSWNKLHRGSLMAHGHSHGNIHGETEGKFGKMVDVGIMNHDFKPLFIEDFIDLADSFERSKYDNH